MVAMATDLAEFVGAALGLNLLFGVPLFAGRAAHGGGRIRHPGPRAARPPPLRARHRRRCSAWYFLASSTTWPLSAPRRRGIASGLKPHLPGLRRGADRGRHRRGDGDAARRLPAFGVDQESGALPRRQRAAHSAAVSAHRRADRPGRGRPDQPGHDVHRRVAVSPRGRGRGRLDERRARRARPAGRRRGRVGLRGGAARVGSVVLERRDVRGPGRDARFHPPSDPALHAAGTDHAAVPDRARPGPSDHAEPGRLAGAAVVRDPVRARSRSPW